MLILNAMIYIHNIIHSILVWLKHLQVTTFPREAQDTWHITISLPFCFTMVSRGARGYANFISHGSQQGKLCLGLSWFQSSLKALWHSLPGFTPIPVRKSLVPKGFTCTQQSSSPSNHLVLQVRLVWEVEL